MIIYRNNTIHQKWFLAARAVPLTFETQLACSAAPVILVILVIFVPDQPGAIHLQISWCDEIYQRWQMLRNAKCQMQFSQIDSFSGWMMWHDATILWIYMILYASMYANNLFYREPESSWHARLVVLPYHFRSFPRQFNCKQQFRSKCQVSMLKHLILV